MNKIFLIVIIIVIAIAVLVGVMFLVKRDTVSLDEEFPLVPRGTQEIQVFEGKTMMGSKLPGKSFCPDGVYLTGYDGAVVAGQKDTLLLRKNDTNNESQVIKDSSLANMDVKVSGIYPAADMFCEALLCECEDYILVQSISKN